VRVFADSEFTVEAEGATISGMMDAGEEGYYYELTNIAADTTVVIDKVEAAPEVTYDITLDRTNYENGTNWYRHLWRMPAFWEGEEER
jgi:hypothetical protein